MNRPLILEIGEMRLNWLADLADRTAAIFEYYCTQASLATNQSESLSVMSFMEVPHKENK